MPAAHRASGRRSGPPGRAVEPGAASPPPVAGAAGPASGAARPAPAGRVDAVPEAGGTRRRSPVRHGVRPAAAGGQRYRPSPRHAGRLRLGRHRQQQRLRRGERGGRRRAAAPRRGLPRVSTGVSSSAGGRKCLGSALTGVLGNMRRGERWPWSEGSKGGRFRLVFASSSSL